MIYESRSTQVYPKNTRRYLHTNLRYSDGKKTQNHSGETSLGSIGTWGTSRTCSKADLGIGKWPTSGSSVCLHGNQTQRAFLARRGQFYPIWNEQRSIQRAFNPHQVFRYEIQEGTETVGKTGTLDSSSLSRRISAAAIMKRKGVSESPIRFVMLTGI